jgi:DNA-directed RNA polymerase specialized sigma24 family protein
MVVSEPIPEHASTKTLVEFCQGGDPTTQRERERAFTILVYRFRADILKACEILCNRYGHNATTAEMIAERTFAAYFRKGRFNEKKGKGKSYDESFLLYLLRIAERELINFYREEERKKKNPYNGSEQLYFELPEPRLATKLTDEMKIELEVVRKFSYAHRTIYLTYKVHQRAGFKMPRPLLATLRKALNNITQDTVNCYLKEARDEVKNAISVYKFTQNIKSNGKGKR